MRTAENLAAITEALSNNCGDFYSACKTALVSPSFVRKWMEDDEKVREAIDNAQQVGFMGLESAAIKRAVQGVEKGVWYQGEQVGSETQYSDGLLMHLLKKRVPGHGDEAVQTNVQINLAQQIKVMPRANSYEEWLAMVTATKGVTAGDTIDSTAVELVSLPAPEFDPAMADIL